MTSIRTVSGDVDGRCASGASEQLGGQQEGKKVLVGGAEVVDAAHRFTGHGVAGEAAIRWPELMRFKRTFTEPVPEERERALAEAGIATFHGQARCAGATTDLPHML